MVFVDNWLFVWGVLGALIGYAASQARGYSGVAGILGGIMLGPAALLMFMVSGVSGADSTVKCPHCAEWIKHDAKVCKHCHRDVAKPLAAQG